MTSSNQKISGFDRPHVSEMLSDSKISTLESGFKNFRICLRIRRMRVDDSRIRKEKVADSKISGYVWTGPEKLAEFSHPETIFSYVRMHYKLHTSKYIVPLERMFGHRMGSDKVCEGCFFIYPSERIWAIFIVLVVLSSTKTSKKLDELSFVVRIGRRTTKDGIKTANGVNTEQFNA